MRDKILLFLAQIPLHKKMHSDRRGLTELTRNSMIPCNNWSAFPSDRHKAWIMQYQPLSDWQEPGPWAPRAWNSPYIKTSFHFYSFGLYSQRGLGNLHFTWNLKNKLFPNSPAMLVQGPQDRQGSGQLCHQPQKLHFRTRPSLEQLELSPGWSLHTELSVSLQAHNSSIIV